MTQEKQGKAAGLPQGYHAEELSRRARTMRLVRLECEACGYRRDIPHVAVPFLALPASCDYELIDEAVETALEKAALARIERLASGREQAVGELTRRLVDEGFGEAATHRAIERALTYHWIDDNRFASIFVSNKIASGWGSSRILRELKSRGIDEDVAQAALRDAQPEDDEEGDAELMRAIEQLRRKPVSGKNVRDKLFRRLISRGYSVGVASEAVSRYLADES